MDATPAEMVQVIDFVECSARYEVEMPQSVRARVLVIQPLKPSANHLDAISDTCLDRVL